MQASLEESVSPSHWTSRSELTAFVLGDSGSRLLASWTIRMTQYYFLNLISTFPPQVLYNSANQRGLHPVRWEGNCIVPHWWDAVVGRKPFAANRRESWLASCSPDWKGRNNWHQPTWVAPTSSIIIDSLTFWLSRRGPHLLLLELEASHLGHRENPARRAASGARRSPPRTHPLVPPRWMEASWSTLDTVHGCRGTSDVIKVEVNWLIVRSQTTRAAMQKIGLRSLCMWWIRAARFLEMNDDSCFDLEFWMRGDVAASIWLSQRVF